MNNNVNSMPGQELLCFRLQTVRRKKRMQHEDFEKRLLALHKEQKSLWAQKMALGWVDLKPTVMKGWKRYFVLRDDVARSKQAAFFEGILSKINTVEYSSRKDFKRKKRKFGKKIYVARDQQLSHPCEYYFKKLNFTDKEAQFFEERYSRERFSKTLTKRYIFTEPWRFVLRVRPNIITKVRARDEAIEKRLEEIEQFFSWNALDKKLRKLLNGNTYKHWKYYEDCKEKNPLKGKTIIAILNEIKLGIL